MPTITKIYCCQCQRTVSARLRNGQDIYPHRPDLVHIPFWQCPECFNYVGCHHKTSNPTTPLGVIPTPAIKELRKTIHSLLDHYWQSGQLTRNQIYHRLSQHLGYTYHTAELRSVTEADKVISYLKQLTHEEPAHAST